MPLRQRGVNGRAERVDEPAFSGRRFGLIGGQRVAIDEPSEQHEHRQQHRQ